MRALVLSVVFSLVACQAPGPSLSTTESELVTISATTWDFGSVQIGQSSTPKSFIVSAQGYSYQTITSITESCAGFSLALNPLPADVYRTCEPCCGDQLCATGKESAAAAVCCLGDIQTYSFSATFTPTVTGLVSCVVNLNIDSGNRTITLNGTGTPPPIAISVNPTSIAFGDVRRGTTSTPITLDVGNTGGTTMTVSNITVPSGFSLSGPTSYNVGPGGTQQHSVTCQPTAVGQLSGNIVISSNDMQRPTVNVPVSCRGIDSALAISPSPMTFTTTRVGEPIEADVVIANQGTASLSLEGVTLTGADLTLVTTPPNGTVAPGASRTARVRHEATTSGPVDGTLEITYDGGQKRTSQISGRALDTSMSVTPDGDVDFGPVCAGQMKTQQFLVRADQDGPFVISSITDPAAPFTVMHPALPANVAGAGANMVTFDVTAAPTDVGAASSTLTLTTDIPGGSPREIQLRLDALAEGVSPSPAAGVDFGVSAVATTTLGETISVSNCTTGAVTFGAARFEGENADDFAVVAPPMSSMLEPSGAATWLVVMNARTSGVKHAEFVVDHDLGTARLPVTGEAADPATGGEGGIDEKSYYSCSTGDSRSLAPLALALLLVRRRRARR